MSSEPGSRPTSRLGLAVVALLLVAGAVVLAWRGIQTRQAEHGALQQRAREQSIPTVIVIPPRPAESNDAAVLSLPGRLEAHARAPLYARVSGYLKHWTVDIGSRVKAGQLLADIDTPDLDQQLLQAQAELNSARANAALSAATARRWQSLQDTQFVSAQAVEEKRGDQAVKEALVAASQANLERLQTLKGFARIVAPFDGVVTARNTDVGSLINVGSAPGTELFVVSDLRQLRLYVQVPQSQLSAVRQGGSVTFQVPEAPGRDFKATVQSLSQVINTAVGSMLVQLSVQNTSGELLPGGFAQVRFALPRRPDTWVIPSSALLVGKTGLRVATVDAQSQVVFKPVVIHRDLGATIELAAGVQADDRVIDSPPEGLSPGDRVQVLGP